MKTTAKMILSQIACDERVPACAMGYIADLHDKNISQLIKEDRINQLKKYVPELIKELE